MKKRLALLPALALALSCIPRGNAAEPPNEPSPSDPSIADTAATSPSIEREPDVIYVPTPEEVVDAMLRLAEVGPRDVVYDLGSGDGRIVIAAARDFGARGVGVDIDPQRVEEARENVTEADVDGRVQIRRGDLFATDVSEASVVTLYLLQSLNEKLRPNLLEELRPGSRIVSQSFDMGDWEPTETRKVGNTTIYLWVVPES